MGPLNFNGTAWLKVKPHASLFDKKILVVVFLNLNVLSNSVKKQTSSAFISHLSTYTSSCYLNHSSHPPRSRTPQRRPDFSSCSSVLTGWAGSGTSRNAMTEDLYPAEMMVTASQLVRTTSLRPQVEGTSCTGCERVRNMPTTYQ